MKTEELNQILEAHAKWLRGDVKGVCANLWSADLRNADLRRANLRSADLSDANLSNADLSNANLRNADLSNANLSNANLRSADLRSADLWSANLSGANLRSANLRRANLSGADLRSADLSNANLRNADLSDANLSNADLSNANLWSANLRNADLSDANLSNANLRSADLSNAIDIKFTLAQSSILPETGPIWGWKKCKNGVLVKLVVGNNAKRSHATGRKCRAEHVKVLEVIGADVGISQYDPAVRYHVGQVVRCDKWNEDRWTECGGGIHFFLTRIEAERYS